MSILRICILLTFVVACNSISCYKCDSIALPACAMTLNNTELSFVDCSFMSLQCVTSIVDTVTYRGCSENTPVIGATFHKNCEGNLCNKGVYPPGRIKCHQCSGMECAQKPQTKPQPCRWHHENDACYTQVIDAMNTVRGCVSDTNHTPSPDSLICKYNGCNDQPTVTLLTCAQCDSLYDRGCKMDLFNLHDPICHITQYQICQVTSLLTAPQTCFFYQHLERVVRGCAINMPPELESEHVTECNEQDICNAQCLEQQKCLSCSSTENIACISNVTSIDETYCASPEISSCYVAQYHDNRVERGCGQTPNQETIKHKYECSSPAGCNSVSFTRCYECSSESSTVCAAWSVAGFGINVEECMTPDAKCIKAELTNGTLLRGCESNTLNCNHSTDTIAECRTCEGSFCNTGPLHDLISCYQCSGASCKSAKSTPCVTSDEQLVVERQSCLVYNDSILGIVRGCSSDPELYYQCMLNNGDTGCQLCYEDGCNKNY